MVARRARIIVGAALPVGLLAAIVWPGVAAAAECTLTAPSYVNVGDPLSISGSGFPASAPVDITIAIDGAESDAFALQTDAAGVLAISLTPEDADIGLTTLTADAGSACTAQVTYTVLAAGATPPPTLEPEATSGAGAQPAPQTDGSAVDSADGSATTSTWLLALGLVGIGGAGLLLTRQGVRR